jgi:hypothetical protein
VVPARARHPRSGVGEKTQPPRVSEKRPSMLCRGFHEYRGWSFCTEGEKNWRTVPRAPEEVVQYSEDNPALGCKAPGKVARQTSLPFLWEIIIRLKQN